MTSTPVSPAPATTPAKVSLTGRLLRNPTGLVSLVILLLVVLVALFGSFLAPKDPDAASLSTILAPPGTDGLLLGGDSAGRDVLSRLLVSTQISVAAGFVALIVALVLGTAGGLVAGYRGGWFDTVSSWLTSLLMALPGMIVLLAARAVLGPSVFTSMAIFGVLMAPAYYRLVYASVTSVRAELYVDAAKVSGLSDPRIVARHILRVVRAPVIIQSAIIMGIALAIQSGLEFLGLGDTETPTWGSMLNDGFANIYKEPILMLWPSLAIAITCTALVLLANAMRDELEQSRKPRRRRNAPAAVVERADTVATHPDDAHSPRGETLLSVRDLVVGYAQRDGSTKVVVHGIDLDVRRGEVHGLIGESGSGKTQTAFGVLGLLPAGGRVVGGSIVFDGTELTGLKESEVRKLRGVRMAYIPQEPMSNLDPSFTIGYQLTEPMRVTKGMSKAEAKEKALALLARVGIPDPERTYKAYPHEVSGGMAQRVLIAGAVSCEPDLLIADEPTTALDVTVQAEVLDLLRDLQAERDMGLLMVTHNFGVVADLCDRVSVMQHGRIVETGPVRGIFTDPRHEYTRALLEAVVLEDGDPRGELGATPAAAPAAGTTGDATDDNEEVHA
ncbi:dipeptide/oligopeptide/nickel ABC transporter permease/ATP-binding protein [Nocardioides sp. GY 10127]|uniref:dipeptide/oligopeptide/nickel ABC transporter permease/ATP-binding protein n=1 Tax=Nocardioides sp. GY 10127 TaxID=2569762 RepID=UPI0010A7A6BB|nr:dipeptide/oligopeptide/nickel ABC transporter permease/ATP-binding protein [Nocardioides sp. GY 10127]TIC85479.1 dipeptide/oligopeptide/nickel ABC transporter permease/ATP-binding protein [Nocardioides sp. GY 10127]